MGNYMHGSMVSQVSRPKAFHARGDLDIIGLMSPMFMGSLLQLESLRRLRNAQRDRSITGHLAVSVTQARLL